MRHTGIRRPSTLETLTTRDWLSHGRHALGVVTWLLLFVGQPLFVQSQTEAMENKESLSSIALGAGCFWCVEAVFEQLEGVQSAVSGYMGGHIKNPGYREVCTGRTGHAEVVLVTFNEAQIELSEILEVFFATHDPTTLNRQGADVGTQYRSAIFYTSDEQKAVADAAFQKAQHGFDVGIVTEITSATEFYEAEDYHQAYYELNGEAPYCRAVIAPKMQKFRKQFEPLLKVQ
jgi:peptide-methionine (S)-S-oxide reductase